MNLIGNAVKFTASGHVRVNCSAEQLVQIQSSSDTMALLKFDILSVDLCRSCTWPQSWLNSDTGIGLSAADVDLLFVPFQQADVRPI